MKLKPLADDLLVELEKIKIKNPDILARANKSIITCRNLLNTYRKEITKHGFETPEREIDFFKNIKHVPLKELVYFSEIRSFEIQFPKANRESQRKHIKKKIKKLNRFFIYNMDFGQYVNAGHTHFDRQYYTRAYLNDFHISTSKFYFQDPDFCTPRDILLAKFKAYNVLVVYLEDRLYHLMRSASDTSKTMDTTKKLHWPFGNTAYVELVYALCVAGIRKHNNSSIVEVSRRLQQVFDIEPKDIYNTRAEISRRKNSRTLFLDRLSLALEMELEKSEA